MMNTKLTVAPGTACDNQTGFSPKTGEDIGYERGAKMVKNYHDKNGGEVLAHFIGRNMIEAILAQPSAVGITILYGADQQGNAKPVMVGVDAKGNYILSITTVGANGELSKQKGIVAGGGVRSPGTQPCGW